MAFGGGAARCRRGVPALSLVSVVIPTYNRTHTLKRAIDSVLAQSYRPLELVVVDDGSTDGTRKLLEGYAEGVRSLFLPQNRGVSAARNEGIQTCRGRYVGFLDSDDEWLPEKLDRQVELLERGPYALVHGEEIWMRNARRVNPRNIHRKFGGWIFEKCLPRCLISPSAVVIDRGILLSQGGFRWDFPVCEDYDLWLRLTCRYEVGFLPDPIVVKYGGHGDQLSRRYAAMDYYRLLALDDIGRNGPLDEEQKNAVFREMRKKAAILSCGYRKRGNASGLAEVGRILARWE